MVEAAGILAELRAQTDTMVAQTEQLARIDSGGDAPDGVTRVCELTGELLTTAGLRATLRPEGGLSAALTLDDGPRLLILGHADTVWPAGTAAQWHPARTGGMLSGPGVGDMKGCLVMAVHALAAARRAGLSGIGAIEVLVVADEEQGSVGSRDWIEERASGAAACLGLEAGWPGGGVVVARGAVGALGLQAFGHTAHCAGHEGRGASAVAALAPLVGELESLSRPEAGLLVSVGVFHGGVARQVVPDRAELAIDVRAPDAEQGAAVLRAIHDIVRRASGPTVRLALSGGITRPAFAAQASHGLWERLRPRAAELGIPVAAVGSRGGSDASFAAALGVPTLDGLGPICHDSCARGERIEVDSLAQRGALMALLILDLAAHWRAQRPEPAANLQARDSGNVDAPA
jgi:glutamate carboxypeptidase